TPSGSVLVTGRPSGSRDEHPISDSRSMTVGDRGGLTAVTPVALTVKSALT
ncbi:hypothetical protein A2U01_0117293, partial [Trifolium medium]|nr:hypothetical protein [Trifolium medium]